MSEDLSEKSTDELLEKFDEGESLIDEADELETLQSMSGPMDTSSVRLPEALVLALEKATGSASDKSSMIRTAVFHWLKENNPEALVEANREIEDDLNGENERRRAAV